VNGLFNVCNLKLTAISNRNVLCWFAGLCAVRLNLLDDIHSLNNCAENDVTIVQPGCLYSCDEELGTICVWSSISLNEKKMVWALECKKRR
jgi:hypothetical protein